METDDEYSEDEGCEDVWCHHCENEIPMSNGICETCNRERLVKLEEYSVYNTFWKDHFLRKGELVETKSHRQRDSEVCCLARRMLKTSSRVRSTTKVDISEMVWLNGAPPEAVTVTPVPKKISKWTDMF